MAAAACGTPQATGTGPTLALESCPPEDGISDALCGSLDVFEDRDAATGRLVSLRIVVLRALSGSPLPDPLFFLAGGPGQAATELIATVRSVFQGVNRDRDLVFVDQRGTGQSNPLTCELEDEDDDEILLDPMADSILLPRTLERLARCAVELDADPRLYTTPIAMDDLDDVREALGYTEINIWGGSYGTRAALVYLRRHPDRVRTAILDGSAPPSMKLPLYMGRDGSRALRLMLDDCKASESCDAAYPELEDQLDRVLAGLDRAPVRQTIDHPQTGEPTEITVTRTSLASLIRGALYVPDLAALLPLAIDRAADGDFSTIAVIGLGVGGSAELSVGMFLSVACSEDVPFITDEDRAEAGADPLLGTRLVEVFTSLCEVWPRGEVPDGYHEPVSSDRPVLLFTGLLDPVTPPVWGDLVAESLTNSLHVTVPGAGHGTLGAGCVPDLIETFVVAGTLDGLDVACVDDIERPNFFDSPLGPGTRGPT